MATYQATASATRADARAGAVLRRHPLAGYFVLAYLGTWLTIMPVVLSKSGIGLLPYETPFAVFALLFILSGFMGPTLSAFIMTAVQTGKPGVRQLLKRYVQWRVAPQWILLTLFGYVVFELVGGTLALGTGPILGIGGKWLLVFTTYLPAVFTFNLVTALGEEPGWRGYALPRLQLKYGPFKGSLILGTLHGMWHLPVFFLPALGFGQFTWGFFLTWIPSIWATTILWTWVFNNVRGSLLIAIVLHSASDAAGSFVAYSLLGLDKLGVAADQRYGYFMLALMVGSALLVLLLTRGRLSYRREQTEQMITPQLPAGSAA